MLVKDFRRYLEIDEDFDGRSCALYCESLLHFCFFFSPRDIWFCFSFLSYISIISIHFPSSGAIITQWIWNRYPLTLKHEKHCFKRIYVGYSLRSQFATISTNSATESNPCSFYENISVHKHHMGINLHGKMNFIELSTSFENVGLVPYQL